MNDKELWDEFVRTTDIKYLQLMTFTGLQNQVIAINAKNKLPKVTLEDKGNDK